MTTPREIITYLSDEYCATGAEIASALGGDPGAVDAALTSWGYPRGPTGWTLPAEGDGDPDDLAEKLGTAADAPLEAAKSAAKAKAKAKRAPKLSEPAEEKTGPDLTELLAEAEREQEGNDALLDLLRALVGKKTSRKRRKTDVSDTTVFWLQKQKAEKAITAAVAARIAGVAAGTYYRLVKRELPAGFSPDSGELEALEGKLEKLKDEALARLDAEG